MYIGASSSDGELAEKYWDGKYRNQKLRKSAEWVRHLFELSDQLKQQARAPSAVTEVVEENGSVMQSGAEKHVATGSAKSSASTHHC